MSELLTSEEQEERDQKILFTLSSARHREVIMPRMFAVSSSSGLVEMYTPADQPAFTFPNQLNR